MTATAPVAWAAPSTLVARRVRCQSPGLTRHEVLDALDGIEADTGLPSSAILAVRRLDLTVAGDVRRLAGASLRTIARDAHRVAYGPPPPDCPAVLFADDAELLVGLATDVAAARPLGWWWATVLGASFSHALAQGRAALVALAWQERAHALPAAMARAPEAMAAAAAELPIADLVGMIARAAALHGATDLAAGLGRVRSEVLATPIALATSSRTGRADRSGGTARRGQPVDVRVPERGERGTMTGGQHVGSGSAGRGSDAVGVPDQLVTVLVDVGAALHRRPLELRDERAARDIEARVAGVLQPPPRPPAPAWDRVDEPRVERAARHGTGPETRETDAPADAVGPHTDSRSDRPAAPATEDDDPVERTVATRVGGVFYLLHLLDDLDLPDAAAGPGEPGAAIDRWGILALLVAAASPEPEPDLVELLTELGTVPAADHEKWDYRRPPAAARQLPVGEPLRWRATPAGRVVVDDPSTGSVIADVTCPPGVDPAVAAAAEGAMGPPHADARAGPDTTTAADRWAGHLLRLVRALLGAVGVEPEALAVPATVTATDLAVTVRLPIDAIDPSIRRAGLDRDPGWVPVLGRVVELVFA